MHENTPKKSLGQHWLHDEDSLEAMCRAGELKADDVICEIGPGLGTLTEKLVAKANQVVALEYDEDLFRQLPKRVKAGNLKVVHADCLIYDYAALPTGYKVIANIPYYLTSNLLRVLCECPNPPEIIALLIQKEVAERVAATAGNMSILSVSVQLYYQANLQELVPAELFTPPPKVDSQVIKLIRRSEPLFDNLDTAKYFRIIKAGFSQKRKKLRSSLSAGLRISKDEATRLLQDSGIDPNCRPQELSLEQWHAVYLHYR
jgi:16S rRNA (adenine1518-N6/adenine1519-N6)-dimethyltransferase